MRVLLIMSIAALSLAAVVVGRSESKVSRIEREISAADDGLVLMTFAARPGVWGSGDHICLSREDHRVRRCRTRVSRHVTVGACYHGGGQRSVWEPDAEPPPVRVVLTVKDGMTVKLKTRLGGQWNEHVEDAKDLGIVHGSEAAGFFLALARESHPALARDAILAACLADSAVVGLELLDIAGSPSIPIKIRESALFWCGHVADGKIIRELDTIASDETIERSLRMEAVSALSMCPEESVVPILMRIARTDPDFALRESAIFGLSLHDDPRAFALLEKLIES